MIIDGIWSSGSLISVSRVSARDFLLPHCFGEPAKRAYRLRLPLGYKLRLILIALIAIAFASSLSHGSATSTPTESMSDFLNSDKYTVEEKVEVYFADIPVMKLIASCESHYRQTTLDGKVYRGEQVPADVGVMQVNESYHSATAKKLGLDLHTLEGNLMYARYLYERQGTTPWNASAKCWKKQSMPSLSAAATATLALSK